MQLNRILTNFLDRSDNKRENDRARGRAKTLAKRLDITIEIDRDPSGNGYWLKNTGLDDENFCTSWIEVEDRLRRIKEDRA